MYMCVCVCVNLHTHLTFSITLNSRYYPNFTDEETQVYFTNNMHNIIWILIAESTIQPQVPLITIYMNLKIFSSKEE